MAVITVGTDLAKNIFAVHGVDKNGNAVLVKPKFSRPALPGIIANLPPCTIGMEVYSGAHYWARLFSQYGHDVKLMAPKFVSPYRRAGKAGKNDAADALAICEAVRRPHMHFVPVKDEEQLSMQCLHRTRQGFIEERTASYNWLRGLVSEFGLVAPQSTEQLRRLAREHRENLPGWVNQCVDDLLSHIDSIELKIAVYDRILAKIAVRDSRSKNIMKLRGAVLRLQAH